MTYVSHNTWVPTEVSLDNVKERHFNVFIKEYWQDCIVLLSRPHSAVPVYQSCQGHHVLHQCVFKMTGMGWITIWFQVRDKDFLLCCNVQTHPASCPAGNRATFAGSKVTRAWTWLSQGTVLPLLLSELSATTIPFHSLDSWRNDNQTVICLLEKGVNR
jgi:hypothetical protein